MPRHGTDKNNGDSPSLGGGGIDETSVGGRFHHLDIDGGSEIDGEPKQEGGDHYSAGSTVEEAEAAGSRIALDAVQRHTRDGSDPPVLAPSTLGMAPPSEDALRQVAQVTQSRTSTQVSNEVVCAWLNVRPAT